MHDIAQGFLNRIRLFSLESGALHRANDVKSETHQLCGVASLIFAHSGLPLNTSTSTTRCHGAAPGAPALRSRSLLKATEDWK
jgi:hypothetical protein